MQLINTRCPMCMGNVVRIPGTTMGECESCGSRFALSEEAAATGSGDAGEGERDEDALLEKLEELISEFVSRHEGEDGSEITCGYALSRLGGKKKMKRAREYFDIDDDVPDDEIRIILDTTIMGSGKVGFAICDDGWYCKDEDGDVRYLNWDDFAEEDIERDGGTIEVGGSKFFSRGEDARPLYELLRDIQDVFG